MWPTLSKNDVLSLCQPFLSLNKETQGKPNKFSGVIFFDVGSVLLDLDWESYENALKALFKPHHQFCVQKFKELVLKEKLNSIWSQGKIQTSLYAHKLEEFLNLSCENNSNLKISPYILKQIDALVVGNIRPEVLSLTQKLRKNNFVIGLLSNTTPWHVQCIYEKLNPTLNFDIPIYSNDVFLEKPDVKIYDFAHKEAEIYVENKYHHKLKKHEVYFVDDTPHNVTVANDYGWNARLVNLIKDEFLTQLNDNTIEDNIFQQLSQKRENLLFSSEASKRVEVLFGNLIS